MGLIIEGLPREVNYFLLDFDGTIIDVRPKWWAPIEQSFVEITGKVPDKKLEENASKIVSNIPQKASKFFLLRVLWNIGKAGGLGFIQNIRFINKARLKFSKSKYINELIPGVSQFLQFLDEEKIPVAIVTTAGRDEIDNAIKELNGFEKYQFVTRDDVTNLKPHPEPVLKGIAKLNADPETTVFVGDFKSDILSGNAANVMTIGLTSHLPEISTPGLQTANPTLLVQYLSDIRQLITT